MKFILLLGSMLSFSAFAVPVKNCPSVLTFAYSDVRLKTTAAELIKSYADGLPLEEEEIEAINQTFKNIEGTVKVSRTFELKKAKNGRCAYRGPNKGSNEKIEIYSKGGQDYAILQTDIGPRGILARLYAKLDKLSEESVELKGNSYAGLSLAIPRYPYEDYDAGGNLIFIGSVRDLSLIVEK